MMQNKTYGYCRRVSDDEFLESGIYEITKYCTKQNIKLSKIFIDQLTKINDSKSQYIELKQILKPGDSLIISDIGQLGNNKEEMLQEFNFLKMGEITVRILDMPLTLENKNNNFLDTDLKTVVFNSINDLILETSALCAQAELEKFK